MTTFAKSIIGLIIGALFLVFFALNASAAEVCPEEGKVESVVDGDIDDVVLEEGTLVCIKGGQTLVTVIADGSSTLRDLLGANKNVSHYTVLESPTTTTTTSIPTTTTTTVTPTTTTVPEETTTTHGPESTTTTNPQETTTSVPSSSTTLPTSTTSEAQETGETLPFTGVGELGALAGLALTLLASGGLTLAAAHKE